MFVPQLEPSESASSSNLSLAKPRPNSELNGQSPSHLKVQRSVSSNHKQRRYSEQGEEDTPPFQPLCLSLQIKVGLRWSLVARRTVKSPRSHGGDSLTFSLFAQLQAVACDIKLGQRRLLCSTCRLKSSGSNAAAHSHPRSKCFKMFSTKSP